MIEENIKIDSDDLDDLRETNDFSINRKLDVTFDILQEDESFEHEFGIQRGTSFSVDPDSIKVSWQREIFSRPVGNSIEINLTKDDLDKVLRLCNLYVESNTAEYMGDD